MLTGPATLIVEAEYIIAMDVMTVIETTFGGSGSIVRSVDEASRFLAENALPDLAIIEMEIIKPQHLALARQLLASGVRVIGISADSRMANHAADLSAIPILIKPVPETEMVAAVREALR